MSKLSEFRNLMFYKNNCLQYKHFIILKFIFLSYISLFFIILFSLIKKTEKINDNNNFFDSLPKLRIHKNLFSIIIPIYNREIYIKKIIKNILFNMSIPYMELVFIDDGSSDNSVKIIEQEQKKDKRIILIKNNNNLGMLTSRYIGFKNSKGKYIAFGDSDDLYCNNVFNYGIRLLQNYNIDYVYFKLYLFQNYANLDFKSNNKNISIIYHGNKKYFKNSIQSNHSCNELMYGNKNSTFFLIKNVVRSWNLPGKIYKREIIEKAYNFIGNNIINDYNIYGEDVMLSYSINYFSNNIIGFNYIGYLYNINQSRKTIKEKKNNNFKMFKSLITLFSFLMRETKNEYICKKLNTILKIYNYWNRGRFKGIILNKDQLENINLNRLLKNMEQSKCIEKTIFNVILNLFNVNKTYIYTNN